MTDLIFSHLTFSALLRKAWVAGGSTLLAQSEAADASKAVLIPGAGTRPKYYFGEAYAASQLRHASGLYGSYSWLMNPDWPDERRPNQNKRAYKAALDEHFPDRTELNSMAKKMRKELGKDPRAPDLWLIAKGVHRFIEVKIRTNNDRLKSCQAAGLALIAHVLGRDATVSVEVMNLYEEGQPKRVGFEERERDEYQEWKSSLLRL